MLSTVAGTASADLLASSHTTLTAYVSEQAIVSMPSSASFQLDDASDSAAVVSASVREMALDTPSALRISVKSDPADSAPAPAGSVRWSADGWVNATGHSDTLTGDAYTEVATAASDAASLSTTNLTFRLAGGGKVKPMRDRTVRMSWKVEYLGL